MEMPLSEIIDRYTITLLKKERTPENVDDELTAYQNEINKNSGCEDFINRLKYANATIWDLETEAGRPEGEVDKLTLEKIGRIALQVRHWNKIRNGIKAEIVDRYKQGFKEIRINYSKHNYGRDDL